MFNILQYVGSILLRSLMMRARVLLCMLTGLRCVTLTPLCYDSMCLGKPPPYKFYPEIQEHRTFPTSIKTLFTT